MSNIITVIPDLIGDLEPQILPVDFTLDTRLRGYDKLGFQYD